MSSIITPYIILPRKKIGSRELLYDYRKISDDLRTTQFIIWLDRLCAKKCKEMTQDLNAQWLFRLYMAARMILGASLTAQAYEYSLSKNLRIIAPHLLYNSMQSASRSVIFTCPLCDYQEGKIFSLSHTTIINKTFDILKKYDAERANEYSKTMKELKFIREHFTYKFSSSGDSLINHPQIPMMLILLCEVAQLQSEIFEQSYNKHVSKQYDLPLRNAPNGLFKFEDGDNELFDSEDEYRLSYLKRKFPRPTNIRLLMTEGWVEDFFYAWAPPSDNSNFNKEIFNPEENPGILFDVFY